MKTENKPEIRIIRNSGKKRNRKFRWDGVGKEILSNKNRSTLVNHSLMQWIDGLMHYINYSNGDGASAKPIRHNAKALEDCLWSRGWQAIALEVKRLQDLEKKKKLKARVWEDGEGNQYPFKDKDFVCAPWN